MRTFVGLRAKVVQGAGQQAGHVPVAVERLGVDRMCGGIGLDAAAQPDDRGGGGAEVGEQPDAGGGRRGGADDGSCSSRRR